MREQNFSFFSKEEFEKFILADFDKRNWPFKRGHNEWEQWRIIEFFQYSMSFPEFGIEATSTIPLPYLRIWKEIFLNFLW